MNSRRSFSDEYVFERYTPHLIILSFVFFVGAVIGSLLISGIPKLSDMVLSAYTESFISAEFATVFIKKFFSELFILAFIVTFSFFRIGAVIIPILIFAKGFGFAALITAFVKIYGAAGYIVPIFSSFFYSLGTLSIIMLIATQGLDMAQAKTHLLGKSRVSIRLRGNTSFLPSAVIAFFILFVFTLVYSATGPSIAGTAMSLILK